MPTANLLYKREYPVNDFIHVRIPLLGDILDNEDDYYSLVTVFTAMPVDLMVQLDDVGIDFSQINEWELFLLLFPALQDRDTSMIFGDLDLKPFHTEINEQNGNIILCNPETGVRIDRALHAQIADALRKINHLEKNKRKPANGEAKKYMIERARKKLRRQMKRKKESQLENMIVACVNTEQFKYNFETVRGLTIYQFNESVRQVAKKVSYDNLMYGVYAGTIKPSSLNQDELNWMIHK